MNRKPVLASYEFDLLKFRDGVSKNNIDATKKWAPFADIATRVEAMGDAAYYGHLECVKALLEYVDPQEQKSWPLVAAMAGYKQHKKNACFEFLYPLSNPDEALQHWIETYGAEPNILLDEKLALEQKQRIEAHVSVPQFIVKKKI